MKYSKIIMFISIILAIVCVCNFTFAKVTVDKYKPSSEPTMTSGGKLQSLSSRIIGTITTVGIIFSVLAMMLLGMKYMMASVEEKANFKKTLIPIIVGLLFIVLTSTIIKIVYSLTKSVTG